MATWQDVRDIALALPGVTETVGWGSAQWRTGKGLVVWDRPLRAKDREHLGAAAPTGDILGVRVTDEGAKAALIADSPEIYFTIPHFDGYPAVLIRLGAIGRDELAEVITDAWLLRVSKRAAAAYLAEHGGQPR